MTQTEWIFHVCGHQKRHRIFGSERIKTQQRAFYRARHCEDCQTAHDKVLYGRLQPTGRTPSAE